MNDRDNFDYVMGLLGESYNSMSELGASTRPDILKGGLRTDSPYRKSSQAARPQPLPPKMPTPEELERIQWKQKNYKQLTRRVPLVYFGSGRTRTFLDKSSSTISDGDDVLQFDEVVTMGEHLRRLVVRYRELHEWMLRQAEEEGLDIEIAAARLRLADLDKNRLWCPVDHRGTNFLISDVKEKKSIFGKRLVPVKIHRAKPAEYDRRLRKFLKIVYVGTGVANNYDSVRTVKRDPAAHPSKELLYNFLAYPRMTRLP